MIEKHGKQFASMAELRRFEAQSSSEQPHEPSSSFSEPSVKYRGPPAPSEKDGAGMMECPKHIGFGIEVEELQPTPRTDQWQSTGHPDKEISSAQAWSCCRQLERELAAERKHCKRVEKELASEKLVADLFRMHFP
jgi:hypothetical protein